MPAVPDREWRPVLTRYVAAALTVRLADEGARVSLVLLSLDVTHSAAQGGLLVAALLAPHVVAAPAVGLAIDRSRHRRRVLAGGVLVFAAALAAVAGLLGRISLWAAIGVLLVGGCAGPVVTGGLTSQLPALVGAERETWAFGVDSLFYTVASMAGPALVGVTATLVGARDAQFLLAGSALVGAALVAGLPLAGPPRPAPHGVSGARGSQRATLASGAREIIREPTLRVLTLTSALGQLGPGAIAVVAAVLATSWHRPAVSGFLLTTMAAGSFLGSLLWTWHPLAPQRPALVTTASMIGVGLPIALSAADPSFWTTSLLFALSGFFVGPFSAALFSARNRYASAPVRTQVFTIGAGLKVAASATGAALIGLLDGVAVPSQLLIVAASPLLAGLLGTILLTRGSRAGSLGEQEDVVAVSRR